MTYKKYSINNLSKRDRAFINNVSLNSMRFYFHTYKIIKKVHKKGSWVTTKNFVSQFNNTNSFFRF